MKHSKKFLTLALAIVCLCTAMFTPASAAVVNLTGRFTYHDIIEDFDGVNYDCWLYAYFFGYYYTDNPDEITGGIRAITECPMDLSMYRAEMFLRIQEITGSYIAAYSLNSDQEGQYSMSRLLSFNGDEMPNGAYGEYAGRMYKKSDLSYERTRHCLGYWHENYDGWLDISE